MSKLSDIRISKDTKYHFWMNGVKMPNVVVAKVTFPKPDIKISRSEFRYEGFIDMEELSIELDDGLEDQRNKYIKSAHAALENMLVERIMGPYRDKGRRQW